MQQIYGFRYRTFRVTKCVGIHTEMSECPDSSVWASGRKPGKWLQEQFFKEICRMMRI